jgi:DNA-binding XRE family transcriptional regulator
MDEEALPSEVDQEGLAPRKRRKLPVRRKRGDPQSQLEREMFARNMKALREEAGLTQRDLARLTGLMQSHISQIETADFNMTLETMVIISRTLKKPLHRFFEP